jgi:DNA replication protein DnaC
MTVRAGLRQPAAARVTTTAVASDLLEILDDCYGRSATVVVTQVPVAEWHSRIPDPALSDAILDRLIHNAYRLELEGESMRKVHSPRIAHQRHLAV